MNTLENLSLKQLQYFAAVAEYGSFRQAAFRLNITQPTLSNQVGVMEKALNIQLFERTRKGINTTPQGRELLLSARRVLEEAQGFTTQAALLSGGGMGTYRLGVTPTLGPYLLPHILNPVHDRYTELKLYVREDTPSDLETGLINGQHDLILTTLPIMSKELVVAPLFREPLKLALAKDHRLGQQGSNKPHGFAWRASTNNQRTPPVPSPDYRAVRASRSSSPQRLRGDQPRHPQTDGGYGYGHRFSACTLCQIRNQG